MIHLFITIATFIYHYLPAYMVHFLFQGALYD